MTPGNPTEGSKKDLADRMVARLCRIESIERVISIQKPIPRAW